MKERNKNVNVCVCVEWQVMWQKWWTVTLASNAKVRSWIRSWKPQWSPSSICFLSTADSLKSWSSLWKADPEATGLCFCTYSWGKTPVNRGGGCREWRGKEGAPSRAVVLSGSWLWELVLCLISLTSPEEPLECGSGLLGEGQGQVALPTSPGTLGVPVLGRILQGHSVEWTSSRCSWGGVLTTDHAARAGVRGGQKGVRWCEVGMRGVRTWDPG